MSLVVMVVQATNLKAADMAYYVPSGKDLLDGHSGNTRAMRAVGHYNMNSHSGTHVLASSDPYVIVSLMEDGSDKTIHKERTPTIKVLTAIPRNRYALI